MALIMSVNIDIPALKALLTTFAAISYSDPAISALLLSSCFCSMITTQTNEKPMHISNTITEKSIDWLRYSWLIFKLYQKISPGWGGWVTLRAEPFIERKDGLVLVSRMKYSLMCWYWKVMKALPTKVVWLNIDDLSWLNFSFNLMESWWN